MDGGAARLRREARFEAVETEGRFAWVVTIAVVGAAGAVSFDVVLGEHGSATAPDPVKRIRMEGWSRGLCVHAYEPTVTPSDAPCSLLHGGRCYPRPLPDFERDGDLLVRLAQPGGMEYVYARLEQTYFQKLVPSPSVEELAARERERGALMAEARLEGEPQFVAVTATMHVFNVEETPEGRFVAVCACGYKSAERSSREGTAEEAEDHLTRVSASNG